MRIGKMTDYAFVLLNYFCKSEQEKNHNARDLAHLSHLPLPTVSKILKVLAKGEILISQRGANGGYRLARSPQDISVSHVIACLEGPIALTECSQKSEKECDFSHHCPLNDAWWKINQTVIRALSQLDLKTMNEPGFTPKGLESDLSSLASPYSSKIPTPDKVEQSYGI